MIQTLRCAIPKSTTTYDIEIRAGSLDNPKELIQHLRLLGSKIAIITDNEVKTLYGMRLQEALSLNNFVCELFYFPHGENHKTRQTKEHLEDQLLEKGFGRDSIIIALGGGVVSDIAGLLAATYKRGLPLITIPTTLLAMVDASIGGKNGVNTPYGKNMIGTVYHPNHVMIDPLTLNSLPRNELKFGIIEMIKHGLIADAAHFEFLERNSERLLKLDPEALKTAIFESCQIKVSIVQEDERDKGKRNVLNFGHTIAHSLELVTDYLMPHGQAVALGIITESHIALQLGHLDQHSFNRIINTIYSYGLPLEILEHYSFDTITNAMISDKKSVKEKPRFVLINGIGSCLPCNGSYCNYVADNVIKNAIEWMQDALCRH